MLLRIFSSNVSTKLSSVIPSTVSTSRNISSMLKTTLESLLTEQSKIEFIQRVDDDNKKRKITEYELRRGDVNPNIKTTEEHHTTTFGDGEGAASPYFRKRYGDSAVLVCMINIQPNKESKNIAENILQPWFIFTHRSYNLRKHRGEMSFPGGKIESDETIDDAALREGFEEINIPPENVKIWTQLRPSLTRNLKNNVTPVVGMCDEDVIPLLKPQDNEVQSIYLVPLSDMIKTRSYTSFRMPKHRYTLPLFESTNFKIVSSTSNAYISSDKKLRIWGLSGVITDQVISCLLPSEMYPRELHTILH